jgi:uncharacterized protein
MMPTLFKKLFVFYLNLFLTLVAAQSSFDIANAEKDSWVYSETWKNATVEQIRTWLETQPNLEAKDSDEGTVLFWAVQDSSSDVVKELIRAGANVNAQDDYATTPLLGATYRDVAMLSVLLEAGAEVNAQNNAGMSALILARDTPEIVVKLLEAGADANITNDEGKTALMYSLGNPATMLVLIDAGADVNAQDNEGRTALFLLIEYQIEDTILQESLGAANEVLEQANVEIPEGFTEQTNPESSMGVLLEAGAKVDTPDNNGNTPLMIALSSDNKNLVNILLEAGANVNLQNIGSNTALMLAASDRQSFIARLLETGAQVNLQNSEGKTALMFAAFRDKLGPVRELLGAGADISPKDTYGKNALDYADGNVYWLLLFRTYRYALLGTVAGLIALVAFWLYYRKGTRHTA